MKLIASFAILIAASYSSPVAPPHWEALNSTNRQDLMPVLQEDGSIVWLDLCDILITTVEASLSDVTYYLYTRSNRNNPTIIKNANINQVKSSPFSKNKLSVFITHGWRNYYKSDVNTEITSAILDNYDMNVFVVDWSGLANRSYKTGKNAVPQIGKFVGQFIKSIQSSYGLSGDNFVLVGHSLGAHVVGCAGAELKGNVNTVIGLDPAGPCFKAEETDNRIDPTDGKFVHIIHTDGGYLGYFDPIGHTDYYPNGGVSQPGCVLDMFGMCAHGRSHEYFAESVRSNKAFMAKKCNNYNTYKKGSCNNNLASPMGGIYVDKNARGTFYLQTNSKSPYGRH